MGATQYFPVQAFGGVRGPDRAPLVRGNAVKARRSARTLSRSLATSGHFSVGQRWTWEPPRYPFIPVAAALPNSASSLGGPSGEWVCYRHAFTNDFAARGSPKSRYQPSENEIAAFRIREGIPGGISGI